MLRRFVFMLALLEAAAFADPPPAHTATWEVYFSPGGGAQEAVVKELQGAKTSVFVQAYSFTNQAIAKALVDAHKRGIDVEVVLDKSNRTDHYTAETFLENEGISVSIDSAHAIAHNKVMIVDGATVITGSYNFTKAAETENAENLVILRDPSIARVYYDNWKVHRDHCGQPVDPVHKRRKGKR